MFLLLIPAHYVWGQFRKARSLSLGSTIENYIARRQHRHERDDDNLDTARLRKLDDRGRHRLLASDGGAQDTVTHQCERKARVRCSPDNGL